MNYKYGFAHTRIDRIYKNMRTRCENPNAINYEKYGGNNISVCDEWKNDKTKFFEWAFSNGYSEELTLDRIDNDKGYCPENCKWSTPKQQANNKRNNTILSFNGESHTLSEWEEITGISQYTLSKRLQRGWNTEKTLTTEVKA